MKTRLLVLAVFAFCASAFAGQISYSTQYPVSFDPTAVPPGPNATTNWLQSPFLPLFDPSLGTLTKVTLSVTGAVQGDAKAESQDASPSTIHVNLAATLTGTGIGGLQVIAIPAFTQDFNATAYDGTLDFGGTSGISYLGVSGTGSNTTFSTNAAVLSAYTGVGTFGATLSADGSSSASGPGNVISQFSTSAGAQLTVTYDYNAVPTNTPEPTTMLLLGSALVGLGVLARKRKVA